MAKQQLRSSYIDSGLLRGLMERGAWHLIPVALKSVIDIPETDLMVLIKTFVALGQDEPAVWKSRYPFYLRKVVETPRNDIFMQQALKQLAAAELPILLKAIVRWLKTKDNESSKTIKLSIHSSSELIKRNNVSSIFITACPS